MLRNYLFEIPQALRHRGRWNRIFSAAKASTKSGDDTPRIRHVLGIETSCDDTGVAIVSERGEILAEGLSSQWDVHEQYGGVYPMLAARAHEKNFHHVYEQVKLKYKEIFYI